MNTKGPACSTAIKGRLQCLDGIQHSLSTPILKTPSTMAIMKLSWLNWLKSYLKNLTQVGNVLFSIINVTSRVPHCSHIGPILLLPQPFPFLYGVAVLMNQFHSFYPNIRPTQVTYTIPLPRFEPYSILFSFFFYFLMITVSPLKAFSQAKLTECRV